MNLTGTSDVVRIKKAASTTTTDPLITTFSKILTVGSGLGGLIRKGTTLVGTSTTTIVSSPTTGQHIQTTSIIINNLDTVSHTFTLEVYDGTNVLFKNVVTITAGNSVVLLQGVYSWT